MERSLFLTAENILCHLRQYRSNNKDLLEIIKLLEHVDKHGCQNRTQLYRIVDEIVHIIYSTNTQTSKLDDDAGIIGCVTWLTYLQEQQKLPFLNESQFGKLCQWLFTQIRCNDDKNDIVGRICIALGGLFATHPINGNFYFVEIFSLNRMGFMKYLCCGDSDGNLIIALQLLETLINTIKDFQISDEQSEVCAEAGRRILNIYYGNTKPFVDPESTSIQIHLSLQILHKIVGLHPSFAKLNVPELLGLSKLYFHFGVGTIETSLVKPQKVNMSQQALYDSAEEIETRMNSEKARSCGGKTQKTRKPRAVVKNTRSPNFGISNQSPDGRSRVLTFDMKISDSDVSEPENATNRVLFERSRKAKIRLASIALVGAIVRILERRILYGYWHALFPSGSAVESIDNLLYVGQHDPNLRCRSAALQVCAHLLYGSKGFLHQAEINVKRCPTTFIPFSVSLGFTVLAIYKSLITILASESSLPVLTQALKCLAVLVQATPFQRFEKGFVPDFVKHVKPLVYHRDATIQVSALMVMEFLAATPETTLDIAEAMGVPFKAAMSINKSKGNHIGDEEIEMVDDDEFVEFEEGEVGKVDHDIDKSTHEDTTSISISNKTGCCSPWLLLRVLHNLSKQNKALAPTSVRIESLQVLIAICSHFTLLKPCLSHVSEVLQHSLNDALSDVRLYAARCVDTCGFQINRYLLDVSCSTTEVRECHKFWLEVMPIVLERIRRNSEEMTTVRIALCDALSNLGVLMFEHMPHPTQINLLSFLSGVSSDGTEDTLVRVAAVRALAVFAQYPSLRGDLVFIENTAELALRLVQDSNLLVRVKAFWSLGNISDSLIGNTTDLSIPHAQEHISDDLLYRLIEAATSACGDNDKVRCNAVRTLGNHLRLLSDHHFQERDGNNMNWRQSFEKAVSKLTDCIRSSGNSKVKWNTCYAISNLMRNRTIFKVTNLNWQNTLYPALCHVIVHHSNFKVRINATSAITNITERSHFGSYFEQFWSSILEAIEQSYNLDNFHEYNHRDNLQEQLCLALSHILNCASIEDFPMLKKHLLPHLEIISNTWKRVVNRMVPEKAAPLLSCAVVLLEREKAKNTYSTEQRNAVDFLIKNFSVE